VSLLTSVLAAAVLMVAPQAATPQTLGEPAPVTPAEAPRFGLPGGISREDSILEARTRALAAELRCPVCQGLSLADSPSELSQEMKSVIREQLRAGKSEEEVRQYFISKYGEWILLEPEARGFNLLIYALPVLGLIAGIGVLATAARRWTRQALPEPDASIPPAEDEDVARV
jgi:cytochrome c-type biogenesis protein CcmH